MYVHFPLDKIISFVYLSGEKWGGVSPAHRSCAFNLCILYTGARKIVQTGIISLRLFNTFAKRTKWSLYTTLSVYTTTETLLADTKTVCVCVYL